ncbi:hypothetical protein CK203_080551 [Vitis vinifera]|uniref:Uncharacterized protein n=1 Tax=Vitis vinifera TaxID=29760 RepID=A0A438D9M1_VITVI|nr:hypothetical protein CK203_080551 [Vitis vinifera]
MKISMMPVRRSNHSINSLQPKFLLIPSMKLSMSKNAWVSEVWNLVGDGIGWTPLFARAFNDWEIDLVERLLQKIQASGFKGRRKIE